MNNDLQAIFSKDGLLSGQIDNYLPRDAQLQMAKSVADVLQQRKILLCEAGTGTGKTFAYLIPAILSGLSTIISTGTKNLQDQLFYKDLPVITAVLEPLIHRQLKVSLLKGRGNYVCLYRFEKACDEGWYDQQTQADLQTIKVTLRQTEFADKAEFTQIKEQSPVWPVVTSTGDNCLGGACPNHDDCYVLKAREQAFDADIIIVNHHLLMADIKFKKDALGNLLPLVAAYIIDEAHQLPDIASRFFSRQISSRQIKEFLRDIRRTLTPSTRKQFEALDKDVRKLLDDLSLVLRRYQQRGRWADVRRGIKPLCEEVLYSLNKIRRFFETMSNSSAEFENCYKRSEHAYLEFEHLTGQTPEEMIHWFECQNKGFSINLTPLSVEETFGQQLENSPASWVFTSATLAVKLPDAISLAGKQAVESDEAMDPYFQYFATQLGLNSFYSLHLESPFNYSRQVVLFAPGNMPPPGEAHYTSTMLKTILPIIDWLEGRTFFLFTSYRAMQEAREQLVGLDFKLFVQGDAPKQQLVDEFKISSRAILLGTSSFWEGVDVKGEALSCVIIDKLPFASPHEPVMQARINHLQSQGINAFYQYQLPQAAMTLKQGTGRLIRDINDVGILIIADPRLYQKSYGFYLRQCLPQMVIETELENLKAQFMQLHQQQ